ncbi:MAG: family 78 glycoside hydrolase catalytic domain [Lachnospiraceae bacterium]|nr:family 78 glycoside hydrolase catalytic domain [Lachnospiraceae bacterium]
MKMFKMSIGLLLLCILAGCSKEGTAVKDTSIIETTVNNRTQPLGIDGPVAFSWKMESVKANRKQKAFQILVSDTEDNLTEGNYLWDTGKVLSDLSVAIAYEGPPLKEMEDYFWKVLVWDQEENCHTSEVSFFEMGKNNSLWQDTYWITVPEQREKKQDEKDRPVSEIRYEFEMENTHTGFVWGADKGQYGKHYLWNFLISENGVELSIEVRKAEEVTEIMDKVTVASEIEEFLSKKHVVEIKIEEGYACTFLDQTLVSGDIELKETKVGEIGLWVTRGENNAWYDNIEIKDEEGRVLYQENFEGQDHIFSPFYLKIEEGKARAGSGYLLTPGGEKPSPMFRKTFEVENMEEIESARLYAASLGIYDIFMNGTDINPYYGAPGQSVYSQQVYYRTYELEDYLTRGGNALGIMLGHGRYDRANGSWGDKLALYAQIVIKYKDGSTRIIGSDDSWLVSENSPIRSDDVYLGEYYDAGYEQSNWTEYGFEAEGSTWFPAKIYQQEKSPILWAAPDEGVKCVEMITPQSVSEPEEGTFLYDFGKNFHGVCHLEIEGKKGDVVTIRHGEYLNSDALERKDDKPGTLWTRNLCNAENTDYYIFKEDGTITYSPTFSYRGFRYVQITGIENAIPLEKISGMVLTTENKRTGYFSCSDERLNRLYDAIYTSQLSNYVDVPTDCPQRDERLGWTGDAQVFTYTGSLNADTAAFMKKYVDFLRISQLDNGAYRQIVPFVDATGGSNGWSDAGVIIVWELFQQYGDLRIVKENLSSMKKYVDYLVDTSENYLRKDLGYNDHNALSYMEDSCCNTAQCAYVSGLLAKMCEFAGETKEAEKYYEIQEKFTDTWRSNFLKEDGSIGNWLQSEYALALGYGLYPQGLGEKGAEKLNISITQGDYHIGTGYITTPLILTQLCNYGYTDTAYKLIQQESYPSWGYMLQEASALTESWFTILKTEEEKIRITGSLNHLALGSVGQWFYTDVLGIKRDEKNPAYKHFYLEPRIGGELTYAGGSYDSAYGKIESSWEIIGEEIKFRFVIPANTTATVTLPDERYRGVELGSGEHEISIPVVN